MPAVETLVLIAVVFFVAGWVKGVVGMGLPTVAMGALGLTMPPVQAAALLVVPSMVTNVWQLVAGPSFARVARRLGLMMVFVCIGTALGIGLLTSGSSRWPSIALGTVLALYALLGLYLRRLSVAAPLEKWLSPWIGALTGVLTGATGVFVVPGVPYLSALDLSKEELIQALGLSFTISTLALAVGLGSAGKLTQALAFGSALAVLPALAGMFVGQALRNRLDPVAFRRWFLVAMLLVGTYMAARAALAG